MRFHTGWAGGIAKAALLTVGVVSAVRPSFAQFTELAPLPQGLVAQSAAIWNNTVYVTGGLSDTGGMANKGGFVNGVYHSPLNSGGTLGTWSAANSIPWPLGLGLPASFAYNGRLYLLGGTDMFGARSEVYYSSINPDGSLAAWSQTTPLPLNLAAHAVALSGNRIYLLGGIVKTTGATDKVYYADILPDGTIGTWQQTVSLPTTLFGHKAFVSGGKLFVIGGTTDSNLYVSGGPAPHVSDKVYAADLNADGTLGQWGIVSSLPNAISLHAMASTASDIYVLGGYDGISISDLVYFAPLSADGTLGAWRHLATLPKGLISLAAAATEDYLYAFGGGLTYIDMPQSDVYSLKLKTEPTDATAPSSIVELAGTAGNNGWYVSAVAATLASIDSLSGVAGAYYSLDGEPFAGYTSPFIVSAESGHLLKYYAVDKAGNVEPEKSMAFKIDLSTPAVSAAAAPAPNAAGWNNGPVSVIFTGTDAVSGLAYCEPEKIISIEGANQAVTGYCADYAGWSSTRTLTVNIDRTLPVSSAALSGTYKNGWYSSPVNITLTSTDSLSGIKETLYEVDSATFAPYQQLVTVSTDGGHIVKYYSNDKAGNTEAEKNISFSIDRTAPQAGYTLNPQPNPYGWVNSSVEAVFKGTDTLSGVDICISSRTSVEGAGKTLSGWCRDMAGNVAYSTAVVNIDISSPIVTVVANPAANSNSWNNTSVTVAFSGSDVISGNFFCTADQAVSTEGPGQVISGSCVDYAGNSRSAFRAVNIDMTKPVTTAGLSGALVNGWYNTEVSITLASIDTLSGVDQINYRLERGGVLISSGIYTSSAAVSVDGVYGVYYYATDKAGNAEAEKSTFLNMDRTPPVITISSPAAGQIYAAARGRIPVGFGVKDNLDPVPAFNAFLVQTEDRGSPRGNRPAVIAVTNGQSIEPLDIDDGIWRLTVSATDFADNTNSLSGGTFEVVHDMLPPKTELVMAEGLWLKTGGTSYIRKDTGLKLSSLDDLAQAGDGLGLGVKKQVIRLTAEGSLVKELTFENQGPGQERIFSSTFNFNSAWSLADGVYTMAYRAEDVLGNIEAEKTITLGLDNTAPETAAELAGTLGENGWHISAVTVKLNSNDTMSGVPGIYYQLEFNGQKSEPGSYVEPVVVSEEGSYKVYFYAKDKLGNIETEKTITFKIDLAAPVVSKTITPPANADGWHNTPVAVEFAGTDSISGMAYCEPEKTINTEGKDVLVSGYCRDYAGNSSTATAKINIDFAGPLISAARAPLANTYGWNNTAVTMSYLCTDGLSGVKSCPPVATIASEGFAQSASGEALDYAGNRSGASVSGINIDKTPPVSIHSLSGIFRNGWYSSVVNVVLSSTDSLSGVKATYYSLDGGPFINYQQPVNVNGDGAHELRYYSVDTAGNIEPAGKAGFKIDTGMPGIVYDLIAPANANGWNNNGVQVVFKGTDILSGVEECSTANVSAEGAGQKADGWCRDIAGNISYATVTVNMDLTKPSVSAAQTPAANADGWNNSPVTVSFNGSDNLSGIAYCDPEKIIAAEGANRLVNGYCADYAGWSSTAAYTLSIDTTPPHTTPIIGGVSRNGWYSSAVSITLTSADLLSGVRETYYSLDGGNYTGYQHPLNISGEGAHEVRYYSVDNAGNIEHAGKAEFRIDTAAPAVSYTLNPPANASGWNNSAVSVIFTGTDAVSGVEGCSSGDVSTEGAGQIIAGWCRDAAGNTAYSTATINIDRTSPTITISSPTAGQIFVPTRGRIYVGFGVQDNLNPAPVFSAFLVQTGDKGSPRGARPAVIAVTNGQSIEPLDIDDGIWRLTVSATDFADNTNSLSGGAFEVIHDVLAPRTAQAIAGGVSLAAGVTTYITGDSVLKLSSMDDLVSAEDGIGLGVKKQGLGVRVEGIGVIREFLFENSGPKQGAVFTSTFTASTLGLADGFYSLAYRAEDVLGNIEVEKTLPIGLDNTSPETAAELVGTLGENGWHVSAVTVKLNSNDTMSGVAGIYYQLESNGQKAELSGYLAPFTVSIEGLYKVYFHAKDKLGNTEPERIIAFKIDHANPLIGAERTPLANAQGWNNTAVTVSYLCSDRLSGVKSCPPVATLAGEGSNQSASGEALDYAGNRSSVSISGINIDKTAPVSAYKVEGIVYNAVDGKTYLSPASKLSLSAADLVSGGTASGIEAVEYHIDSGAFEVYSSSFGLSAGVRPVYYHSRDKAGNQEPASSAVFYVDGASPLTSFNIPAPPYIVDGTHYIAPQSILSFAATDPLTDGPASGVLITKYRLDGGAWQVYTASITIPAEGLHKLDYYSIDNVQNAEALRTLNIIVDNTAPVTAISVGEPKFEVFGLKIITPETPVTFAASDSEAAGPASGVKSIYYELTDAAGRSSGTLNYTEPFSTGRQGTYTVRYWSADNAGNTGTPLEAKLRVSSLRSDALDAVDGLELTGSADIAGTVRSNTAVSLAGNARILGDVYASTISLSGKAQITGQQHNGAATLVPMPLDLADIVDIASNVKNNSLIPAKYLVGGRLVVPAKDELTLSTGVYYFNGIDLGGGAKVGVNGKVDILVAGDISINGGASLNAAGSSSFLNIFLSTESALTFTGGGSLAAYVYAPYSQLKLAGNALLGGHYLVKRAVISGAGNIVQSGEILPQAAAATGDIGGNKKASALAVSGSYNVLAGPDPAFRLGEVYVFPNPAKGSEVPVFHIETGIADSVSIKIYTVSGRAAHEYTLTGMPAELDDGNGLNYAYEYAWRGHIPSGVYLYYIETQKAGQKLRKTGKFSVIR